MADKYGGMGWGGVGCSGSGCWGRGQIGPMVATRKKWNDGGNSVKSLVPFSREVFAPRINAYMGASLSP